MPARRDPSAYGVVVVTVTALVLVTAPVSDSWGNRTEEYGAPPSTPVVRVVETDLSTGRVTGRLPRKTQKRVVADVGKAVDRYLDREYVPAGDAVRVRHRSVRVDLLAVGRTARAATARVRLVLTTASHRVTYRGRLFLTRPDGRWKVFGFDMAKGRV